MMVSKFIRFALEKVATKFKGSNYRLDTRIPLSALGGFAARRMVSLLRCALRGIVWNPSKLIFIGANVRIRNRKLISFGTGVTLEYGVLIDGLSEQGVVIGNGVSIGAHTMIEATGVISNIGKGMSIGDRSGIGAFSFIGAAGGVSIGSDVIMGQYVSFHSENHNVSRIDMPIRTQGITRKGIVIEDDCWVGAKVTFLDGAYVGRGSVIAAGAVVRGEIPPYSIAAGVPARVIRNRMVDGVSG